MTMKNGYKFGKSTNQKKNSARGTKFYLPFPPRAANRKTQKPLRLHTLSSNSVKSTNQKTNSARGTRPAMRRGKLKISFLLSFFNKFLIWFLFSDVFNLLLCVGCVCGTNFKEGLGHQWGASTNSGWVATLAGRKGICAKRWHRIWLNPIGTASHRCFHILCMFRRMGARVSRASVSRGWARVSRG